VAVSTNSVGIVTAIDFSGPEPMLTVGRNKIALKDVTNVRLVSDTTPPPPAEEPGEDGEDDDDETPAA